MRYLSVFVLSASILFLSWAAEAEAKTYFVKPDGNDSAAGTTDATAWRTIAKVNAFTFQPGDDVYFKCGGTWNIQAEKARLYIDWSGTSSNRAIIGAYYMNGTTPVIGVSGKKPVFNGGTFTVGNPYFGLIQITPARSYVTVTNIQVQNSEGYGIWGSGDDKVRISFIEVINCTVDYTSEAGIQLNLGDNVLIAGNTVTRTVRRDASNSAACGVTRTNNAIIKANNVSKCRMKSSGGGGECIFAFFNCDKLTIEDNTIFDIQKYGIYVGSNVTNAHIRRNMVYGTKDPTHWWGWDVLKIESFPFPGHGIAVEDEWALQKMAQCPGLPPGDLACRSHDVYIYNNLIAHTYSGFANEAPDGFYNTATGKWVSKYENIHIFNNTVVATRYFIKDPGTRNGGFSDSSIMNNIFTCYGEANCLRYSGPPNPGWNADYNLWPSTSNDVTAGSHDRITPDPKLAKTSGWRAVSAGTLRGADFALQKSSAAANNGVTLDTAFNASIDCSASDWTLKKLVTADQALNGVAWDLGACVYREPTSPLAPPLGLELLSSN